MKREEEKVTVPPQMERISGSRKYLGVRRRHISRRTD
jgi:hypothetical protein